MQEAYIIIDIGTGNVRVAVAAINGEILGMARGNMPYQTDTHYPESIFFDPGQLWKTIIQLTHAALQQAPGVLVRALTATSQREGIVLIGQQGQSLIGLPNIDHRGREWEHLVADKSAVYESTGRYPTSLFSALKLVGVRERRPELWAACATFLSISDWAQYMLSGVAKYEHAQASETLLYDVAQKAWSADLCAVFALDPAMLPQLGASGSILGPVLPAQAAELGISPGARVIVGGADTQLAVKGTQVLQEDVVIVSGTTTPIIKLLDTYVTDPRERSWTNRHIDAGSFVLETNAGVTGLNYQRLKEIFYLNESYAVIEAELGAIREVQCVASLGSLVADEKAPITRGGFVFPAPVSHDLSRAHFAWATLWDIACSIRENYNTLCAISPNEKDYVWACGGGFQSPLLRQFMADLLQKKVYIRGSYPQASVVGGVFTCNEALGQAPCPPVAMTVTTPRAGEDHTVPFLEWKSNRQTFKQLCPEEVL